MPLDVTQEEFLELIENDYRESTSCDVIGALVEEAQKRHWRVIQIAPELPYSEATVKVKLTY